MAKEPIAVKDQYMDRYKSINLPKTNTFYTQQSNNTQIQQRSMSFGKYITEKDRIKKSIKQNTIDSSPSIDQSEVFYKKLRQRNKKSEIVGPLKLKVHSSLERVYNSLKSRCSIDASVYEDDYYQVNAKSKNIVKINSKNRIIQTASTNTIARSQQLDKEINKTIVKPLSIEDQSEKFKKLIMPNLNIKKSHFKAAMDIIHKKEGSLNYSQDEFDQRFKNFQRNKLNTSMSNEQQVYQNNTSTDKISKATREILDACQVTRKKKPELEFMQQLRCSSRLGGKSKINIISNKSRSIGYNLLTD